MKSTNIISDELRQALIQYKNGNRDTFGIIYIQSQKYVYTCIHNVMKGNDNVQDIIEDMMQETYVEVSRSLGQLEDVERFLQWAGTIATRKCYAFLTKNKRYVLLNEEDTTFEDLAGDEKFIPEEVMQSAEKRRLLKDIIDNQLNEMQRICIYEFYYNEKKQSQIAEEYGIPENTVKTHLSRAKAKIKEGVLDLEKNKNTRLYSFAPVFVLLFADDLSACVVPEQIAGKVLSSTALQESLASLTQTVGVTGEAAAVESAGGMAAVKTAGETTSKSLLGKLVGSSFYTKIIIGAVCTGIIIGTGAGFIIDPNPKEKTVETSQTTSEQIIEDISEEITEETTTEMTTEVVTTEAIVEEDQEVTLEEDKNKAVSDLLSNVFYSFGTEPGDIDFNDAEMNVDFIERTVLWNPEYLTDDVNEDFYNGSFPIKEYAKEIFGVEDLNLEPTPDYYYYTVEGDNIRFNDGMTEGDFRYYATVTKTIKRADGTYEIYGYTEGKYADGQIHVRENFRLIAVENEKSPYGFRILQLTCGVEAVTE